MKLNQLLKIKFPNADFRKDIKLQDDGEGVYIAQWNLEEPQPDKNTLEQWALELDLEYRQLVAVQQRVYPDIKDQLDMLYHDMKNGTTDWLDTIEAIKTEFPKPAK